MSEPVSLPRTYRPFGARLVAGVAGLLIIGLMTFLWLMLPGSVRDDFGILQRITLVATFVLILAILYALFRTMACAEDTGLTIINGYRKRHYEWAQVVSISLTPGKPWALIDLADGSTVSVMALQSADGARASRSARELAGVIARYSRTDRDN
ncbi:MAG: PH domain-containing protein [Nocardioidaceae bacterium]